MYFLDSEHVGKGEMLPKMLTISIELGATSTSWGEFPTNSSPKKKIPLPPLRGPLKWVLRVTINL